MTKTPERLSRKLATSLTLILSCASTLAYGESQLKAKNGDVEADLGGVHAKIPASFANYISFSAQSDKGVKGLRKIRGFGFYVRFPDMRPLPTGAEKSSIDCRSVGELVCENTFWLYVSVTSGPDYPGGGYLDRRFNGEVMNPHANVPSFDKYTATNQRHFGLDTFSPKKTGTQSGGDSAFENYAHDIHTNQDTKGNVLTYIKCSKRKRETSPCRHDFSLEPSSVTGLSMSYPRKQLKDWAEIERKVQEIMLQMLEEQAR